MVDYGEWNGDGIMVCCENDLINTIKLSHTMRENEQASSRVSTTGMGITTSSLWACWTQNSLLYSCSTGIASHGCPWGVKMQSNERQMLGQMA